MQKDKTTFSSVISVDPYRKSFIEGVSGNLYKQKELTYSKKRYVIAYLNTKAFISAIITVSKNIPDEDLQDVIENKIYEELALDMAIAYQTNYIEIINKADENNRFFHVFVVDPLTLDDDFRSIIKEIKYIDQIVPLPILLKSLYTREIIDDLGVHCFIFFQKDDTFLTIYNEQEFLYTKSLNFSLTKIHENFCELLGEQIPFDTFIEILSSEGLATNNLEHQKYLIKLFSDIFLHVNDILTYVKRVFQIEKIDTIYIGSDITKISGLDEYAQTYLSINAYDFDFDYGFTSDIQHVSQIHSLMQLYAGLSGEERYECNFSKYLRPPPFAKRQSGKLILVTAASLIIALIYPITNWSLTYVENMRYSLLNTQYTKVNNIKMTREATLYLKRKNEKRIFALEKNELNNYNNTKNTLVEIHNIKVNYAMKAKRIAYLTKALNKYGVQLKKIDYTQKNKQHYFTLTLLARHNKTITDLIKYLTKTDAKIYAFSLKNIIYNDKKKHYVSKLKVTLL